MNVFISLQTFFSLTFTQNIQTFLNQYIFSCSRIWLAFHNYFLLILLSLKQIRNG